MGSGSGVSRGDRNRNARLERLRALVPVTNAIAGIDLVRIVKRKLKKIQCRPRLIAGCLAKTGLTVERW